MKGGDLAFDLANHCGWCYKFDGQVVDCGVQMFDDEHLDESLAWLAERLRWWEPRRIFIERCEEWVGFKGSHGPFRMTMLYGMLYGVIHQWRQPERRMLPTPDGVCVMDVSEKQWRGLMFPHLHPTKTKGEEYKAAAIAWVESNHYRMVAMRMRERGLKRKLLLTDDVAEAVCLCFTPFGEFLQHASRVHAGNRKKPAKANGGKA